MILPDNLTTLAGFATGVIAPVLQLDNQYQLQLYLLVQPEIVGLPILTFSCISNSF